MSDKRAVTDYPVHELVAARWSPYAFEDKPVPEADLRGIGQIPPLASCKIGLTDSQ